MAIAGFGGTATLGMSFLPAWQVKSVVHKTWTPPVAVAPAPVLLGAASANDAVSALVAGSRAAAEQAFLFGLKIALSDADRESSARRYLASTQSMTDAEKQSEAATQALTQLAQSIVSRTKHDAPSAFLSTYR